MQAINMVKAGVGLLIFGYLAFLMALETLESFSAFVAVGLGSALVGAFLMAFNLPEVLELAKEGLKARGEDQPE